MLRDVTARVRLSYWRRVILLLNDLLASAKDEADVTALTVDLVTRRAAVADGCVVDVVDETGVVRRAASAGELAYRIDVPLTARGRTLGAMAFLYARPVHETDAAWEAWLVAELAPRVAIALDNVRLYAAIQRAVATRDDVLAVVSHDLRNILSSIMLQADVYLLLDESPEEELPAREPMAAIRRAASRMNHMIGDLLDVAELDSGALALNVDAVSARALVDEVVEWLAPLARQRSQRVEVRERDVGDVVCDRERFSRVLLNLLSNAIKFTPEGGTIGVSVEARGAPRARHVLFTVRDTGPGIPEGDRERIFERFFRSSAGASSRGTGLGLYIARRIVQSHGGTIWVEATPGTGSAFHVALPARAADVSRAAPSART